MNIFDIKEAKIKSYLKYLHDRPLWLVVLISWGIAFFEYCFMVPANRLASPAP